MTENVKLTRYSHGAGCACKLGLEPLGEVLRALGPSLGDTSGLLVGLDEADDAAVIRLNGSDSDAIVLTVDFFTPIVDDAFTWGRVACANAVSDVYAMGGRPIVALNIAAWPSRELSVTLLADVLKGGLSTARQAGMLVVGGHTVDDPEPKYGLCVVGRVDPARIMTIDAARPGDVLLLTKPIGTGIVATAIKRDAAPAEAVDAAVTSMTSLNAAAAEAFVKAGVRACTDVTGYGLLGHLHRMAKASGVGARIQAGAVPILTGARELAAAGFVSGGSQGNRKTLEPFVDWTATDEISRILLTDAQTSGGLLGALSPAAAEELAGPDAWIVGSVTDSEPGTILAEP